MFQRKVTLGGLIALVAVAACQNPNTTKPTTTASDDGGGGKISTRRTPTPGPSKDPNAPTPTPTQTPQRLDRPPTPVPTPTPIKTPVPPGTIEFKELTGDPNPNGKTTLTGALYDNTGAVIAGDAKVIYKLMDGNEAQVTIEGGKYTLPDLAPGRYAITAQRYGSTPRTQYVSLIKGTDCKLNFGEPNTDTHVYCLFGKPEIAKVEPNQFNADLKGDALNFRISLSEPTTCASIAALVNNLRLAPMNEVAAGTASPLPIAAAKAAEEDKPIDANISAFPWSINWFQKMDFDCIAPDDRLPKNFFEAKAGYTVEQDQFINVTFAAPYLNGKTPAEYQLFVVADPANKVLDLQDKIFGTDATGGLDTNPAAAGAIVNNVFLSPYLGPNTFKKDTQESMWDSTHVNAIPIKLVPDTTPPGLTTVGAIVDKIPPDKDGNEERPDGTYIYLEFNEPITVIGPGGLAIRQSALDFANYSFVAGINTEYLGTTTLADGQVEESKIIAPSTTTGFSIGGEEFKFKAEAGLTIKAIAGNKILIYFPNKDFFDMAKIQALSVRAASIEDPAGNVVPASQADVRGAQPRGKIEYRLPPT